MSIGCYMRIKDCIKKCTKVLLHIIFPLCCVCMMYTQKTVWKEFFSFLFSFFLYTEKKKIKFSLESKRPNSTKITRRTFFSPRKMNNTKKNKHKIVNFSEIFFLAQVYRQFSLYCLVVNKKKEKVGLQFSYLV